MRCGSATVLGVKSVGWLLGFGHDFCGQGFAKGYNKHGIMFSSISFLLVTKLKNLLDACGFEREMRLLTGMMVLLSLVFGMVLGSFIGFSMKIEEPVTSTLYLTLTKTKIKTTYMTITHTITMTSSLSPTGQYGCIIFSAVRDVFRISEPVEFVLVNNCSDVVILPSSAPWRVESSGGKIVFKPVSLQVLVEVGPGEKIRWAWDQRDNDGNQVPAGCYHVIIDTLNRGLFRYGFCIK